MEKKEGKNDMDQNKRRKRAQAFFMVAIVLVFWNLMDHMSSEDKTVVWNGGGEQKGILLSGTSPADVGNKRISGGEFWR